MLLMSEVGMAVVQLRNGAESRSVREARSVGAERQAQRGGWPVATAAADESLHPLHTTHSRRRTVQERVAGEWQEEVGRVAAEADGRVAADGAEQQGTVVALRRVDALHINGVPRGALVSRTLSKQGGHCTVVRGDEQKEDQQHADFSANRTADSVDLLEF